MSCFRTLTCNVFLLLILVALTNGQVCASTRSIAGHCDCHFVGGCDWTKKPPKATASAGGALPKGIEVFAYNRSSPHTTTICEGKKKTLAVLYDCDLRIPLYSARVLRDADMKARYSAALDRSNFVESPYITRPYRQKNGDYGPRAKDQVPCYESALCKIPLLCLDTKWYRKPVPLKKTTAKVKATTPTCNPRYYRSKVKRTLIHKGHLIAASYGKAPGLALKQSVKDTFVLSNAVPQFADLNSGKWNQNEQQLLSWALLNCASTKTSPARKDARLFIVVGTIPSTWGRFKARYFGFPGFSDYIGISKKRYRLSGYKNKYRINVPAVMWTAACCGFEQYDTKSKTWKQKYITKAFWAQNRPYKETVYNTGFTVANLFQNICSGTGACPPWFRRKSRSIQIFPKQALCK